MSQNQANESRAQDLPPETGPETRHTSPADSIPWLTTSERTSFKRCPARWYWAYREGLTPRSGSMGPALWFGIGIHEALAQYYQLGIKRDRMGMLNVFETYCNADEVSVMIRDADTEQWETAKDLGLDMLRGYVDLYQGDPNWDVIAIESPFQLEIPDPIDPAKTIVIFTSTWDGVIRDKNDRLVKLLEHKTSKDNSTKHLTLDDQGGGYWASANFVLRDRGTLGAKESIDGIQYNFLKKTKKDVRETNSQGLSLNKDGSVSKTQPTARFVRELVRRNRNEQANQIRRIASEAHLMEQFRRPPPPQLPMVKNPTKDCSWDCAFFDMCEMQERGTDWEGYKKAVYKRVNPYDRYRKNA